MLSKRNTLTLLVAGLFLLNALNAAVEIAPSNLLIPTSLKGTRLFHEDGNFVIIKDGQAFPIRPEYMDKELRGRSVEELDFVLGLKAKIRINSEEIVLTRIAPGTAQEIIAETGCDEVIKLNAKETKTIISQLPVSSYIQVLQYENGEFCLHLRARLSGGGPLLGNLVYWGIKGLVGAVILVGAGAVVLGTGGLAAPMVAGGLSGLAAGSAAAVTTMAAAGAAGVGAGSVATIATGAVLGFAGAAGAATITTGAAIATIGAASTLGVGGLLATTEVVASAAGIIAGCLPTP
ncbi:MAG: hypothetical protein WCW33_03770 [Candidatus Babeliales bacterium]